MVVAAERISPLAETTSVSLAVRTPDTVNRASPAGAVPARFTVGVPPCVDDQLHAACQDRSDAVARPRPVYTNARRSNGLPAVTVAGALRTIGRGALPLAGTGANNSDSPLTSLVSQIPLGARRSLT